MSEPRRQRPQPSAAGNLQKSPLAHLLAYGYDRQLNGSIELISPDGRTADVVLADGYVAKARTSEPIAYLGRILLELGYIRNTALEHHERKGDILHGQSLVDAGDVTEKQLNFALKVQLLRKVTHMFSFPPETSFRFLREFNVLHDYGGHFFYATHPFHVIWNGTCESPPWEHVQATMQHVKNTRMRLAKDAKIFRFQFQPDVVRVLDQMAGRTFQVADLSATGHLTPQLGQLLAYTLVITKQVDLDGANAAAPAPQSGSTPPVAQRPAALAAQAGVTAPSGAPPAPRSMPPQYNTLTPPDMDSDISLELNLVGDTNTLPLRVKQDSVQPPAPARGAAQRRTPGNTPSGQTVAPAGMAAADVRRSASGNFGAVTEGGATYYERAEQALRAKDIASAEAWCKKGLEAEPGSAMYLALAGFIASMRPERQNAKGVQESIQAIGKAIAINDRCTEAFFFRGLLYKRLNDYAKAIRDFRHAAELNPSHAGVVKELREVQERLRNRGP